MSTRRRAPFTIDGTEVRAGRFGRVDIPTGTLISGSAIALGVQVAHGRRDGPVVFLTSAIHGDEILGVEIIRRVLATLAPIPLAGTVLAVPIVNVHGFNTGDRYLPDGRDLNRSFPGSARGSMASRIAHVVMKEVVGPSELGIDLHTGAWGRTNLPQVRADLSDDRTLELARVFAPAVVIDARLRDGSLRQAVTESGKRVLLYEGGENQRFHERPAAAGTAGVLRVLRHLGMIEVEVEEAPEPAQSPGSGWVRASRSGIAHPVEPLGARVEKGQVVAVLRDPFGRTLASLKSRWAGVVIGLGQDPLVNRGDAICHIARIEDPEVAEAAVAALPQDVERGREEAAQR